MMDTTPTSCIKCTEPINGVAFFRCSGFCGGAFHLKCTSTTQQHMRLVQDVANLFWYCDSCVKVMGTPQFRTAFLALSDAFRNLTEVQKTVIEDVKAELTVCNKKVNELTAKLPANSCTTPTWPRDQRLKRQRSHDSPVKPAIPKSCIGTKCMTSAVPIIAKTAEPDDLWWMWLSSFPPSVTEDHIRSMVSECLSCDANDEIEVKMLVKKDADLSKLTAVTFKVGFDRKYCELSMNGDTWPAGVGFRQFIAIERKPTFNDSSSGFSKNRRVD